MNEIRGGGGNYSASHREDGPGGGVGGEKLLLFDELDCGTEMERPSNEHRGERKRTQEEQQVMFRQQG